VGSFVENVGRCCIQGPGTLVLYNAGLSPYRPVSFDGIVKNTLPGKLFFFDPSEVPL
jgi:hypothetical protein